MPEQFKLSPLSDPSLSLTRLLVRVFLRLLVLFLAYFSTGQLALAFPYIPPSVSLIWLPSGIAVAALIRWGPNMAIGIYLAAWLLNASSGLKRWRGRLRGNQ